jgi:anti-sigma B factor antagonist
MPEAFEIRSDTADGVSVVTVGGEVDVATAPALREQLAEAVSGRPTTLIVDLLGVSFLDSTALGVLIGARKQCLESEVELRLVIAEARILRIFDITSLTELFDIVPTRAEATAG